MVWKSDNYSALSILLSIGAAFVGCVSPAVAADTGAAAPAEGEIVVTARFRQEALLDVPIAITALSGEELAARAQHTVQDIARSVPTLDFRAGPTNKDRASFIRGVGTMTTSPGVEPSVATVIDGVVLARPGQATLDLIDVERIEVLRGPQGTLFGKNASAGVINIVSRQPAKEPNFDAQLGCYEGNEYRVKLGASAPLGGGLYLGLTGLVAGFGGNVRNIRTGEDVNGYRRRGLRGKLLYEASAELSLTLAGDYSYTFEDVPTGVFVSTRRVAFPGGAATDNAGLAAVLAGEGIVPGPDNRRVSPSFDADVRDRNGGVALTIEAGLFGNHRLTAITAYRWWDNVQHQDWDATGTLTAKIARGEDRGTVASDQVSQELRLTSPRGGLIDYVVGLYFFRTTARERYRREVTTLVNGSPVSNRGVADYRTTLRNHSIFGEANVHFTERFRAILGGRLIRDELAYTHARVSDTAAGVAGIRPSFASTGTTGRTDYSARAGLQYEAGDRLNLYATYSRGYKGPAYNVFFNMQAFDVTPLAPETSDSFEAGIKGRFARGRGSFGLAGYVTRFKGFQANFQDAFMNTLVTRLINAGEVSSRGVEGDVTLRPVEGLRLTGAFAWNHARIDRFRCPPSAAPGTCADAGGNALVDGRPLPFAPRWKVNIDAAYRFALGGTLTLELQSDFAWKDDTQYSITQTPDTVQPAYGIWNASIALAREDRWEVRGVVKNIANRHYSPFIAYGSVAGVSRVVPRDNDRYFGVNASIAF